MARPSVIQSKTGFFHGLAFKVGFVIVAVQLVILGGIGTYYAGHISAQIDERAVDRLTAPGKLIQSASSVIGDRDQMGELVGPGLVHAMIIDADARIVSSLQETLVGRNVADIDWLVPAWFDPDGLETQLIEVIEEGIAYRLAISPVRASDSGQLQFFILIKASTAEMDLAKRELRNHVWMAAALCLILTSLLMFGAVRWLLLRRLGDALAFIGRVGDGDLDARLNVRGRDELALLEHHMKTVAEDLQRETMQRQEFAKMLRQSESRFRDYMDSSTDWQWEIDTDFRYTAASYKFFEMTEVPYGSPLGKRIDAFGMELEGDGGWDAVLKIMRTRQSFHNVVVCWHDADGDEHFALFNGLPVYDEAGDFTGYRGTGSDITAGRRAEAEQARLQKQLAMAQKMEAVGQMAGGVAHEFNNCLAGILSFTELAGKALDDKDKAAQFIKQIEKLGERAASVAEQLLVFSRKQESHPKVVRIDNAVNGMARLMETLLNSRISLQIWHDSGPVWANVDETQLSNSIMNLAINARDAMPDGGTLQVSTSFGPVVDLDAEDEEVGPDYVRITVQDTGTGMDEETKDRIFEPFFTTKDPGKGTGLGLALVYGWVEQSNGKLEVDSIPGEGTTFTICLPPADAAFEAASERHQPLSEMRPGAGETILVVDDESAIREACAINLQANGYSVVTASNGAEALTLVSSGEVDVDLVLSDVVMPQMTGPEMARELTRYRPGTPVLFMSGYPARVSTHVQSFPDHEGFIKKPFKQTDLMVKIRSVLDKQSGSTVENESIIG